MAKFPKMTMTKQGLDMLIKSGSGKPEDKLIIVGARLGDGNFDGNIRDLTDLVSPKLDVTLADYKELDNGKAEITCTFTNENINVGFYHREVGILAKNGEDGIVKLLNYSNAGNYTSYLPDKSEAIPIQTLKLGVAIGDAVNVDGHIDFSTAVTVEMLNTAIDAHNKDEAAHPGMIEKHNKDANAHSGFFVPVLGAIMKGILYLVDPADDSNDTQAATTGWTRRMFSTLLQKAFDLAGVQYNLAQNGYVKFGAFFGGLCIQWGYAYCVAGGRTIVIPIAFNECFRSIQCIDGGNGCYSWGAVTVSLQAFNVYARNVGNGSPTDANGYYLAIGR